MSALTCPGHDLLLLVEHELADEAETARVRAHQGECPACQASAGFLADALAAPALPFDPAEELGSLKELLAAQPVAAPTVELEGVRLLCTYCKDGLPRVEASYCAECLAPHHADCHAEHGSCAAAGCEGRAVVGSVEPPRRPERPGRLVPFLFGVVLCGGAMAALYPEEQVAAQQPAPAAKPKAEAAAPPEPREAAYRVVSYPVAGLLTRRGDGPRQEKPNWVRTYETILETRPVTLNFPDTPFAEVVGFLQDITGLNMTISAEVDAQALTVSVRLREIKLRDALDLILDQVGLERIYQNETISFVSRDRRPTRHEPASWPLPTQNSTRLARARELTEEIRAHVVATLGEDAWAEPASLDLGLERLIVTHSDAGHAAVAAYLRSRRGPDGETFPAELLGAWFAPGPGYLAPDLKRARRYAQKLEGQQITLDFDQTPLSEALSFLQDISGVPLRLSPGARESLAAAPQPVSLRLRNLSLKNALNLIVSRHPQLVWEVDRRGVLIRPFAGPSLAVQLRKLAADAEDSDTLRALRRRLAEQRVSLNFEQTPLAEAIDFLRDISGLNYVASRSLGLERTVTVALKNAPLGEALEALLKPHGLGISLQDGVIRLVKRAEASEREELQRKLKALRERPLTEAEPQVGIDLGELAEQLEARSGALVVLGPGALVSRARVALPAGVSVAEGVKLARAQAGLEARWTWLRPEWKPVLSLTTRGRGSLVEAAVRAQEETPWKNAPAGAAQALSDARSSSLEALRALAAGGASEGLETRIEIALSADAALFDVLRGLRALGHEDGEQAQRSHLNTAISAYAPLLKARAEIVDAELVQRVQGARRARDLELARERLQAANPGSDEASARRELERVSSEHMRQVRDAKLDLARLHSHLAQWEARAQQLSAWTPAVAEAFVSQREALVGGAAWEQVFPAGFSAWYAAQLREARRVLERGRQRAKALALGLRQNQNVRRVVVLRDVAPLLADDHLRALDGERFDTVLALVAALGSRPSGAVELTLGRSPEGGGEPQTMKVKVDLTPAPEKR